MGLDTRMLLATKRGVFEVIDEGGSGAGGTPPVLVLVHGFPFAAESWAADATALSGEMRVIAPSMRGFGATEATGDAITIESMADDVVAVLDALGLTAPVVMGGLSMGGYVALAFARRAPQRVRAMLLADTRAEADSDEARANREKAIALVERGELHAFVDGLLDTILAPSTRSSRPEVVARIRAMAVGADPKAVVAGLRALRDRPDARPGLAAIDVPVRVVVGEHDSLTPPAVSRAMAAAIPKGLAEMHVIPDAGHLSNLEHPEAFCAIARALVRDLESNARS